MKTKNLIMMPLIVIVSMLKAQWNGSSNPINTTYSVGIGTTSPDQKLEVETATAEDGIMVTQTYNGAAGLHLRNTYTGGQHWGLFSLNNANTPSGGHFIIYDYTNSAHRFMIDGSTGNIGIGTIYPTNAQLEVEEDASTSSNYIGISGLVSSSGGGVQQSNNVGIKGASDGGYENYGGYFSGNGSNALNYGVAGYATSGPQNIGGLFYAGTSANSIGVEAIGEDYAGYFLGNVYRSGTDNFSSDRILKSEIKPISGALKKIMLLKPSSYFYKSQEEEYKVMNLPTGLQFGLIAQDLELVFPNLVGENKPLTYKNKEGKTCNIPSIKTVQYTSLIPILISAIQEQQNEILSLNRKIEDLNELVIQLTSLNNQNKNDANSVKIDKSTTEWNLEQNVPNPFSKESIITFKLPSETKTASLSIYDLSGKWLRSFVIQPSDISFKMTSSDLSPGIYIYSIISNGKILDSKRMVIAD